MTDLIVRAIQDSVLTYPLYKYLLKDYGYKACDFLNNPSKIVTAIMNEELTHIPFSLYSSYDENINIQLVCQYVEGGDPIIIEYCLLVSSMNDINRIKICNPKFYIEHISWRINSLLSYVDTKSE